MPTDSDEVFVLATRRAVLGAALALLGVGPLPAQTDDSLLVTGVRIVDPAAGTLSEPSDLLIEEGLIRTVAAMDTISADRADVVVAAAGLYALPGLIDVHAHIGDGGVGEQTEADRTQALDQFVRYGVTTIFVPGGGGGNDDQMARWKRRCGSGELRCPDLYGSGALITAPGSHPYPMWGFAADAPAQAVYDRGGVGFSIDTDLSGLLDFKVERGADAIKIVIEDAIGDEVPTPRLSTAQIATLVEEAHRRGLRIHAHVSLARHVTDAVAAGIDSIMHSTDDPLPQSVLEQMARRGVFYVATLSLFDGFFDRTAGRMGAAHEPYALAGVSERALSSLQDYAESPFSPDEAATVGQVIRANLSRAAAAGVPLALGSDVNNPSVFPGYAAHEELELMVDAGLDPARALAAATVGGAAFLGHENRLGRIAPGYEADFLLLRRNPLEDVKNTRSIDVVIHDGRVLSDPVDTRLQDELPRLER